MVQAIERHGPCFLKFSCMLRTMQFTNESQRQEISGRRGLLRVSRTLQVHGQVVLSMMHLAQQCDHHDDGCRGPGGTNRPNGGKNG